VAPLRIVSENGRLIAVTMQQMRLGDPDVSGRRRPEPIEGSTEDVAVDTLIVAIGQRADLGLFGEQEIALTPSGYLRVDPETFETSVPGVYAGGDIVGSGPANIVKAAGDGRRIAEAIIARDLGDAGETADPRWPAFDHVDLLRRRTVQKPRVPIPHLAPEQRSGFAEVVQTLSPEAARREAARCLDCDLLCSTCDSVCPNRAILTYWARPARISLPRLAIVDGDVVVRGAEVFRIEQGPQVAVLTDACNECGNCVTFCPTADRPWRDKPRLYLNRDDFDAQTDNAFMLLIHDGGRGIQARSDGVLCQLMETEDRLQFTSPSLSLTMDSRTLAVLGLEARGGSFDAPPVRASQLAAMIVLHRSFAVSAPEFPLVEALPDCLLPF
jgi:putative selenate reductase